MVTMTSEYCAHAFLCDWVSRFSVPSPIVSDQRRQFESSLWSSFNHFLDTDRHKTTAYHLQANGVVERFHRQLEDALRARLDGPIWADKLPIVLLRLRSTLKEDLNCMTAELVFGWLL